MVDRHDQSAAPPRGELEFLRRLRPLLAGSETRSDMAVPFGDDMAGLPDDPGLLWTVDMLMDGVDFDSARHGWHAIGRKAMAANLSDCAAMGVQPVAALCAVALHDRLPMDDALALHTGAHEMGLRYNCPVVGGDTNSWAHPTAISITVAARALPDWPPVRRNGARPGDRIWLTGPVGGSILGRHMTFEPRVELGLELNRRLRPTAMIDISDGLALDLSRVLDASGCGAVIDPTALEAAVHADALQLAAQDGRPAREHALYDGEDFELIAVLPPETTAQDCRALGLLPLGVIISEAGLFLEERGQRIPLAIRGWEHFR